MSAGAPSAGSRRRGTLRDLAEREAAMAPLAYPTFNLLDAYPLVQSKKMRDGVRIVGEKRQLGLAGSKQSVRFLDQMTQLQHAQAYV